MTRVRTHVASFFRSLPTLGCLLAMLASLICAASAAGQAPSPPGDYGDAPDGQLAGYATPFNGVIGQFPTRFDTSNGRFNLPGGHTLVTGEERVGVVVSMELGARDPDDPDTVENLIDDDFDDGLAGSACPVGALPFPPAPVGVFLRIRVTVAAGAPTATRFVNVLIDLNNDGQWSGSGAPPLGAEWVAIDFPVNVPPGTTQEIVVPSFLYPLSPVGKWMRIALTRTPVVGSFPDDGTGWDGSGTFGHGEMEDFLLASDLAFANAGASDFAFSFATQADFSLSFANAAAAAASVSLSEANASVSAASTAAADASANAVATAAAAAAAAASANAAASACQQAQALASALASSCATCACATACASAQASAQAMLQTCATAQAAAESAAAAAAAASAEANAQASAAATAVGSAQAQASAAALAVATAQANAVAVAVAVADAVAAAAAASAANATGIAAACGGNAEALASAVAGARAQAAAAADAFAFADTDADAAAAAATLADASASAAALAEATAVAAVSATAFARAQATAAASTAAAASATTESVIQSLTSAQATATAFCSGDCCSNTTICIVDQVHVVGPFPLVATAVPQGAVAAGPATPTPSNVLRAGTEHYLLVTVESRFTPVAMQAVGFKRLLGTFVFTGGMVTNNGAESIMLTPTTGQVQMTFRAVGPGPGLVEISAPGSGMSPAYILFFVVP